jgi:hypothetical protein
VAADGYDQVREDCSAVAHTPNMVFGLVIGFAAPSAKAQSSRTGSPGVPS